MQTPAAGLNQCDISTARPPEPDIAFTVASFKNGWKTGIVRCKYALASWDEVRAILPPFLHPSEVQNCISILPSIFFLYGRLQHASRRILERYSYVRMEAKRAALETLAKNTGIEGYDTNRDTNRPSVTVLPS
jgi:hypothetical protein